MGIFCRSYKTADNLRALRLRDGSFLNQYQRAPLPDAALIQLLAGDLCSSLCSPFVLRFEIDYRSGKAGEGLVGGLLFIEGSLQ